MSVAPLTPLRLLRAGLLTLAVLMAAPTAVHAQEGTDGSIYSRYGLGQLGSFTSAQAHAMGGGGLALLSYNYANTANPASLSDQVLTRASLGLTYQTLEATDVSDNLSRLASGSLQAVQFSFPLRQRRLGVGVAFKPYSRRNYRVAVDSELTDPDRDEPVPYAISYQGNGGLQQVDVGLGYRLNRHLSFGATGSFLFGLIEDARVTTFEDPAYDDAIVTESTRLSGFTGTLGAMLTVPRLLSSTDLLAVGASVMLPVSLDGDRVRTFGESLDRDTLGTVLSGSATLPMSARLGLAYTPNSRWTLIADGLYEPWSSFESSYTFSGYDPAGTSRFTDRLRFSGGAEVVPAGDDLLAPYLRRVAYRIGFYYDQAYIQPTSSTELHTVAGTLGLGLPTLIPGTRIDLTIEVGTRGTTERALVRELFYSLSANVNIGERWFNKRKLR